MPHNTSWDYSGRLSFSWYWHESSCSEVGNVCYQSFGMMSSLDHCIWMFGWNLRQVLFKLILVIHVWGVFLWILPCGCHWTVTDDKSTILQVMAWCRKATSHFLDQWWPCSVSPNVITIYIGQTKLSLFPKCSQKIPYISQYARKMKSESNNATSHDDVIKWRHFPHYCPFVRGIRWIPLTKASDAELLCIL